MIVGLAVRPHLILCAVFVGAALSGAAHAADSVPEVQRFHGFSPSLSISGQPRRAQFAAIAKAGYRVVINVAAPDSNPDAIRDEKALVEAAGMAYHYLPLNWEKPDASQVVAAVKLLRQFEAQPTLVHCYVGSRASLIAYLYRTTYGNEPEPAEKAMLEKLWSLNKGYELHNAAQWQMALEDARDFLRK